MDINVRAIDGSAVTISLNATSSDLHPWTTRTMVEYAGRGKHQISRWFDKTDTDTNVKTGNLDGGSRCL